jgi:hypothetical protein
MIYNVHDLFNVVKWMCGLYLFKNVFLIAFNKLLYGAELFSKENGLISFLSNILQFTWRDLRKTEGMFIIILSPYNILTW